MKNIGIMTGGGDCPGLNAAIRAVVRSAYNKNIEVVGFKFGWLGILEKKFEKLNLDAVSGILPRGGTLLGSSRINPLEKKEWPSRIQRNLKHLNIHALIIIGGDGTLRAALELSRQIPLPFVAIPKTIDNDLMGTDFTFGFDTAVSIATEAIDRLHTTAESHQRVMIIEVMGRNTGWIATYAGLAGGADFILIPEVSVSLSDIIASIQKRHDRGKTFSLVVVAEGAKPTFSKQKDFYRHNSIGEILAHEITEATGFETRVTILGHVQRGGSPTPADRILATRLGTYAADLAFEGRLGQMAALQGQQMVAVPLKKAVEKIKPCDLTLYKIAQRFFG